MALVIFAVLALACAATAARMTCTDDITCGINKFCYLRQYCASCTDCSVYKREGTGACTKHPSKCGECLPGFEPEILTDGMTRDLCVPVMASTKTAPVEAPLPQIMMASGSVLWLVLGPLLTCVVIVFAVYLPHRCRSGMQIKHRTRFMPCNDSNSTSSATLYAPTAPHFHTLLPESKGESERSFRGVVYEKANSLQQAAMFENPNWVRSPPNPPEEDAPIDAVDGPNQPNPPEDFPTDEDTRPSDWTPGPNYEESSGVAPGPLITSFQGILRLNSAANGAGGPQPEPTNHTANSESASHINVTNITVINAGPSNTGISNITKT